MNKCYHPLLLRWISRCRCRHQRLLLTTSRQLNKKRKKNKSKFSNNANDKKNCYPINVNQERSSKSRRFSQYAFSICFWSACKFFSLHFNKKKKKQVPSCPVFSLFSSSLLLLVNHADDSYLYIEKEDSIQVWQSPFSSPIVPCRKLFNVKSCCTKNPQKNQCILKIGQNRKKERLHYWVFVK